MSIERFLSAARVYELWEIIKTALLGKQDKLTPDESIMLQSGSIGVKTPVNGVLTQEEYAALPEARKTKGVYIVPDDGAAVSGFSNIYSTEETVIGRWIDGKPLYRLTISLNSLASNLNTWNCIYPTIPNLLYVINISGVVTRGGTKIFDSIPTYSGGDSFCAAYDISNGMLTFTNYKGYINSPGSIIIEYTKTTDEGGST